MPGWTEEDLPEVVFNLELLRLDHQAKKHCEHTSAKILVDQVNHFVHCGECGAILDPFAALVRVAKSYEDVQKGVKLLLEQRKEIAAYKPHLKIIKQIEQDYRGRKMLPCCPHCGEAFYLEELAHWTNRELVERRRAVEREQK